MEDLQVTNDMLFRLSEGMELDDNTIFAYLKAVEIEVSSTNPTRRVRVMDTFFFADLDQGKVVNVSRRFEKLNPFELDLLLLPLHLPKKHHWALIASSPKLRRIQAYDSLNFSHKRHLYSLFYSLRREAKLTGADFRSEAWHIQDTLRSGPKQPPGNNVDCGVYVAYYAENLSRGSEIDDNLAPFSPEAYRVVMAGVLKNLYERNLSNARALNPLSPFSPSEGVVEIEKKADEWDKIVDDLVDALQEPDRTSGQDATIDFAAVAGPSQERVASPADTSISLDCSDDWLMVHPSDDEAETEVVTCPVDLDHPAPGSSPVQDIQDAGGHCSADNSDATPLSGIYMEGPAGSTRATQFKHEPSPGPRRRGNHQPRTRKRRIYFPDGSWKRIPERLLLQYRGYW